MSAYDEWADCNDPGRCGVVARNAFDGGVEACALKIGEQRCICVELIGGGRASFRPSGHYRAAVTEHDPACPKALMKMLRSLAS